MTDKINYAAFVDGLLSDPSKDLDSLINRFKELQSQGCDVPRMLTGSVGLSCESGEFEEIVKKIIFQGKPYNEDNIFHMKRELSDMCFYLQTACLALGTSIEEVLNENVKKLEARYPGGKFDAHYSENRKPGDL